MWRGKSHHAAISRLGLFEIVRAVNIKARQGPVGVNPACGSRPSIGGYNPAAKPKRDQYGAIKRGSLIKIVCSIGDVTEHPLLSITFDAGTLSSHFVRRGGQPPLVAHSSIILNDPCNLDHTPVYHY